MNWKYWVIKKMKPNRVKKATVTEPLAAVKRRLRNRLTSSIGSRTRSSHAMNAHNSRANNTKPATLCVLPQPRSGASMIV